MFKGSRGSVAGVATRYGLDDRGIGVRVPVGLRIFLLHVVQTGSGVHLTSYPMCTGALSPGVKRPGREFDHLPPANTEVKKNVDLYIHSPIGLMA
jgi:hypothetical protein